MQVEQPPCSRVVPATQAASLRLAGTPARLLVLRQVLQLLGLRLQHVQGRERDRAGVDDDCRLGSQQGARRRNPPPALDQRLQQVKAWVKTAHHGRIRVKAAWHKQHWAATGSKG